MPYQDDTCRTLRHQIDQYASRIRNMKGSTQNEVSAPGFGPSIQNHKTISDHLKHAENNDSPSSEPWKSDDLFLKRVSLSKQASYKILQHAVRGGDVEIMGMLVGTVQKRTVVVYDSYSLPVEGTETRVNAQLESYEYMVQYMSEVYDSRPEKCHIVGWYHSHPGYGCWLSGIDVQTQELNQTFQDPYVAVVVDPKKTLQENRLSIGAFRTVPVKELDSEMDPISTNTEGDERYGHHSARYYELELEICESKDDVALNQLHLRCEKPVNDFLKGDVLLEQLLECVKNWHNYEKLSSSSQFILNASPIQTTYEMEEANVDIEAGSSFVSVPTTENSSDSSPADENQRSDVDMTSSHLKRQLSTQSSLVLENSDEVIPVPEQAHQEKALALEFEVQKMRLNLLKLQEYQRLRHYRDAFTL
ncbi:LAME_0F16600g1_1 [Lachancea meyersii CBS 8951]|uniref:COP9 signalosome complex subunit 5 n=1 Tax=Lachancea meyersii CBS 8951 TaxID=1266667 RepID=A0A1G4JZK6_9SACH|nr:LAME_0F16600g1_1 [Lachancea meyersii CBS 8951]